MDGRPRIGLNAQLLSGAHSYRRAGIHQYIDRLLVQLPAVGADLDMVAFVQPSLPIEADGLRVRATRWPTAHPITRIAWEQTLQAVWARQERLQLLHGLAFVSPLIRPCRTVITVYDLSFAHFPELFRGVNAAYLRVFTRLSCRAATRVIAISESTRADVVRLYGVPAGRVDVARPGVDPAFRPLPPAQVKAFRCARGLPETFILHVGTLEPRKNHLKLLEAFARASLAAAGVKLICVGGPGWHYQQIYAAIERWGLAQHVILAGYAPADELALWYNAASLFVYPSRYEGFGLPILEAMACGTPVITSNVSSLPEAAGQAGQLVSPDDVDELAAAMRELLAAPALRRHLSQAGRARAAEFRWEQTARETVATWRKSLAGA